MSNMVVRTNIFALNAHRNMKNVGLEQGRASNRLSSGFRINSAADDAAGLAISENMRAQIRGLDQASRNAQDGQAMLLTTEGGLEEIGNMLQRSRELLVQASNDTNTQNQRTLIEQELGQLAREILSMQNRVEFNTNRVLAMGPQVDSAILTRLSQMDVSTDNLRTWSGELSDLRAEVQAAIDLLNEESASASVSQLGGAQNAALTTAARDFTATTVTTGGLGDTAPTIANITTGVTVADALVQLNSRMTAIGLAETAMATQGQAVRTAANTNYTALNTWRGLQSSGDNVAFFQVGANSSQGISFDFETVSRTVSAAGRTMQGVALAMSAPGEGSGIGFGIRVSPLIGMTDTSIAEISSIRANLGAVQNRMDYTMRSLDISSENLQDSESRVRNADIAREMMRFTMANVLQQAAVSMLAQANQMPQNLLQLLR